MILVKTSLVCFLLSLLILTVFSDFLYVDFNNTDGLIFNGDSGTTVCYNDTSLLYGDVEGKADLFNQDVIEERSETTDFISVSSVQTSQAIYNAEIQSSLAGFLHRNDTISAPTRCSGRARLTPSGPSKIGSLWYRDRSPVVKGFDTYFTFQISDHSKECTYVKDQYFSKASHRTCSVHGADGFAFVIQNSPNETSAIGQDGGNIGFGGIESSIAIAFDTWTNPGEDTMFADHVSVQSMGTSPNNPFESGLLGVPRTHKLADGVVHMARITYYGDLQPQYFNYLVASDTLLQYLKDNGEQKRIGTLLIFLDDGILNDTPLIAMPINLSLVLRSPDDKSFVGFTSSTGRFYEKHDILSWYYCDHEPCDAELKKIFDYYHSSYFFNSTYQVNVPGPGYGGGYSKTFPVRNQSPKSIPLGEGLQHFAPDRNIGLSEDAINQIPPNTLY